MSNSLVHKSLELLGYDELRQDKGKKRRKRNDVSYKGVLDLIPTKYRILSTNAKTDLGNIRGRSSKVTVYEIQKQIAAQYNPTDENVQRLLLLSNNRVDPKTTNNLLHRATKQKYVTKQEKLQKPEETAFTEEDFEKFKQEYVE